MKLLWLGRGTLTLRWGGEKHTDNVRVYFPGEIIEEAAHLAELGEKKIAELVKDGKAEFLKLVEGVLNIHKAVETDVTDQEKEQAQTVATEVTGTLATQEKAVEAQKKNILAAGGKVPQEPVPTPMVAGPMRSST